MTKLLMNRYGVIKKDTVLEGSSIVVLHQSGCLC